MNNLYNNAKYTQVIVDLKAQLKDLRKQYKEDNPKFACNKVINEYWDYGPKELAKAIEISHQYRKYREQNNSYK